MSSSDAPTASDPNARRTSRDKLAGRLAALGAGLGVLAGVVDVAIGPSIRGWIGNKLDPTPLGLLTVILSAVALAGAIGWTQPGGSRGSRRLGTILAFLLPAVLGFTTIGRLWYLPGALLLSATGLVTSASARGELADAVNPHRWLTGLTALLGAYYLFLGGDALPAAAGVLGILGALVVWTALLSTHRSYRLKLLLLIVGALPFAVVTWWSIVTPLVALLVLTVGPMAIHTERADHGTPHSAPAPAG